MPEFMILRNAAARRNASGLENVGPDPTPPEPRIETQDLSLHEAVSAARDPDVAAVAIADADQIDQAVRHSRGSRGGG